MLKANTKTQSSIQGDKNSVYLLRVAAFTLIMLCITGMHACQPTPKAPVVVSKGDGKLQDAIYGTIAPLCAYSAPQTWTESIKGANETLTINVDAEISVPSVTAYPVYQVNATAITQDDADAFINAFIGGDALYSVTNARTKPVIQAEIEKIIYEDKNPASRMNKARLSGELSQEEYDRYISEDNAKLKTLREEYKSAPQNVEKTKISRLFHNADESICLIPAMHISGYCVNGENASYVSILTEPEKAAHGYIQSKYYASKADMEAECVFMGCINTDWQAKTQGLNDMVLSYDEAKAVADKIIAEKLGYSEYCLSRACSETYTWKGFDAADYYVRDKGKAADLPQRYVFIYTKCIDGIPMLYFARNTEGGVGYGENVLQHCLCVTVQDTDTYYVYEQSTMQKTDKLNENVSLLPFDKVQEIFRTYIAMKADFSDTYYGSKPLSTVLNINDIRLGYIRTNEKDNTGAGLLLPVWLFYGLQTEKYDNPLAAGYELNENCELVYDKAVGHAFLCINAIDGSIIDLSKGY